MSGQEKITQGQGVKASLLNVVQAEGIAQALAHPALIDGQKCPMHPISRERLLARRPRALGNFIRMLDTFYILAAGGGLQLVPLILHTHRRALDVPAGKTDSPGTVPLHIALLTTWREFPKSEVSRAFFLGIHLNPRPRFYFLQIRQFAIGITRPLVGGHIKINSVVNPVGKTGLLDLPDELDLLLDVICGLAK